ncbi:VWA domain-containing protein [Pseudorhodobacter sp. E13]|uniref:vWA domain-containing protein n=1 Tax=Pseudorhodobacter sp. E13 TaxID=2487931 RepID=UPI000F8C9079|nr:VWA domain-containing protein [Pseudorhodobacter sp. E13]RUS59081.1 VWA domain-containing protein [Pseudorhodobacter sp. E13]
MRLIASLCAFFVLSFASPLFAQGKSIIVLDGSGSMWGQIDGRPKLEIAREALAGVLAGLSPDTELGLIAYGHRQKGECSDIELIVPPAKGSGPAIAAAANAMQFLGKTPLTEAVRRAAADLRSTEEKATVILITDGIETCEADPCALGAELEASGVDFTAHVVGFGLTAEEGKQVACLAEATGGQYIEAKDAGSLTQALQTTVAAAPEVVAPPEPEKPAAVTENFAPFVRLVAGGPDVAAELRPAVELFSLVDGARGDLVSGTYDTEPRFVEPGTYLLVVTKDLVSAEQEVVLTADALAQPEVILNAGRLTVRPLAEAGGAPVDGSPVDFTGSGGISSGHYGVETRILPVGEYEVTVRMGNASARAVAVIDAGADVTLDVVVASGLAVIDTYYTPDMLMEDVGQAIDVYAAKKALDGSRERVAGGYGAAQNFTLPPGDYVAVGDKEEADAETAFTVKPNERVDVKIVLNAGVLAIAAPGARVIEVFKAKPDIQGNRTSVRYDYGEAAQTTLPAGDYIAVAERDGVKSEAPATVIAGERTEITVP